MRAVKHDDVPRKDKTLDLASRTKDELTNTGGPAKDVAETIAALKQKAEMCDRIGQHEDAHRLRNRCALLQLNLHMKEKKH